MKNGDTAFSLLELLAVLGVIGLLAALAVPAMNSIMRGSQLTQGAQMLSDQIGLARQTAVSLNRIVEVRFYQYSDSQMPGEVAAQPGSGRYRAMQVFQIQDSGSASPLGKIQRLPNTIVMDATSTLSSLLGRQKTWDAAKGDPQTSIPYAGVGTSFNCSAFRFLPDGSTDLTPPTDHWFITLHSINTPDGVTSSPSGFNFFTIQIDPANGHVEYFRP
jgi:uncharacterized protein (TIGR02596 family)